MSDRKIRHYGLFIGAAVAAAAFVVAAFIAPKSAMAGWLVGFTFWSQVPVGSLALLLIHRLTGGNWGRELQPGLEAATSALPWLLLLILPVFIALPVLYPWADHSGAAPADVVSHYLNVPLFILRSIVALAGWSALALLLPGLRGPAGRLAAALGLVFHAVVISSVARDWVLSLEPPFVSSSFGASVAITQLLAALAWAAALYIDLADESVVGDIGGLLLAFLLGITYIDFMAVLVIWYGDLPHEEAWFVERDQLPWSGLGLGTFLLASLLPIAALLLRRVRNSRAGLRRVATSALVGLALYQVYLIAPPFQAAALLPALLALIAIGLFLAAVIELGARAALARRRLARAR